MNNPKLQPYIEGGKEIARWLVLFVGSWIITEVMKQINLVPEFHVIKVWVFTFFIPVRIIFSFLLTLAGRFIDKVKFEKTKANPDVETKGWLWF